MSGNPAAVGHPEVTGRLGLALGLVTFLLPLLLFAPTLANDFVGFDDRGYVLENEVVRGGLSFRALGWAFTTSRMANWHPLTWASHQLDVTLFGLSPAGHHASSVLLHALSSLLLFGWLKQATGSAGRATAVALLWSLHPLRVESVAWVAERKDVLCGFFAMASLHAWNRFVARGGLGRYLLVALLLAAGLASKSMLVTWPCVLFLLDFWPYQRASPLRTRLLEKLPLLLLGALASAVALRVIGQAWRSAEDLSPLGRLNAASLGVTGYLLKTVWPAKLSVFYPLPTDPPSLLRITLTALAILLALSFAFRVRHRAPAMLVGLLWFFGMLVPVSGLFQNGDQLMADRYTYLPSVGLLIAVVYSIPLQWAGRLAAAGVAVVAALCATTSWQLSYWSDPRVLFEHAREVAPGNFPAEIWLSFLAEQEGDLPRAELHARAAVALSPKDVRANRNLARILLQAGSKDEALQAAEVALSLRPEDPNSAQMLGRALFAAGRHEEALMQYRAAAASPRADPSALLELAARLTELNHFDEAEPLFEEAARRSPKDPIPYFNLGIAFSRLNRLPEAVSAFEAALLRDPRHEASRRALDRARQRQSAEP